MKFIEDQSLEAKPLVSYIIPVYQAESFICNNLNLFVKFCSDSNHPHSEIIIVNDGSTDRTHEIIEDYIDKNKNVLPIRYINLPKNVGKGLAIKTAVELAYGRYLIFTDCDLPYSFRDIKEMAHDLIHNGANVVIASRMHRDSVYKMKSSNLSYIYVRHTIGRLFNKIVNLFMNLDIEDTQAGLKGFDRETAMLLFSKMTVKGFCFDVDILTCARENRKRIVTIPVEHNYESEMSTISFLKHGIIMLFDLKRIFVKKITGYYRR